MMILVNNWLMLMSDCLGVLLEEEVLPCIIDIRASSVPVCSMTNTVVQL